MNDRLKYRVHSDGEDEPEYVTFDQLIKNHHYLHPASYCTVEQCTGLSAVKSCRGDEPEDLLIYEGDLAVGPHPIHPVYCGWNKCQLRWSWYVVGIDDICCHLDAGDTDPEIIGTIHDKGEQARA